MSNFLNPLNIKKVCRICLEGKGNLLSIYSSIVFENENIPVTVSIPDILLKIASETVNGENYLPEQICVECIDLLRFSYIFKLKYEKSSSILQDYVTSTVVKEENQPNIEFEIFDNFYSDNEHIENESIQKCEATSQHSVSEGTITEKKVIEKETVQKYEATSQHSVSEGTITEKKGLLHPCPICTAEFTALELRRHAHTHTALKKYLNGARKVPENARFQAKHRPSISLFYRESIDHKCPYCNDNFPADQFRIHVENHRKQDEFKCDQCDRVFRKISFLSNHKIKHMKECPYKCEECGKGFVIKKNYDCHLLTHTDKELPHKCKYCLKRFSNPEHLHRHLFVHTQNISYTEKYKVCRCPHCKISFKDKTELQNHPCKPVKQSSNVRYKCKLCHKVFKSSSSFYSHNRNTHKFEVVKSLCSVCGSYVANIYSHMMKHTGRKPYSCNQCDKRFAAKPQLKQHLLVHSGLKPYVCSVCGKAFNNLYNLQVHERIHIGNRCHICHICEKGFLEKSYLRKHMNIHKNLV